MTISVADEHAKSGAIDVASMSDDNFIRIILLRDPFTEAFD